MPGVHGKGNKLREVPMPSRTLPALSAYLVAWGLQTDLSGCEGETFLIGASRRDSTPTEGISAGRIYEILREFFMQVASALQERGKRADARLVARASTHWLRQHVRIDFDRPQRANPDGRAAVWVCECGDASDLYPEKVPMLMRGV
jgi:hypothetical protein